MSRVDVIVPCYKYGHYLRECVESVLSQIVVDVRVLIIDDASPDRTPEVAAELAAQDERVEYRRHFVNRGHIETYNEGLQWATGDYVLLLSADDLLTPGALLRATRLLDAHPEVGLTYGRDISFQTGQPLKDVSPSGECSWKITSYQEFLELSCSIGHTPIESPAVVIRNRVHRMVGGYRKELPHSADTELWLRLAAHASVGILDADQAFRRWHNENMTYQYDFLGERLQQKAAFDIHFQEYARQIVADIEPYRRRLLQPLAEEVFWNAFWVFEHGDKKGCKERLRIAVEMDPSIRARPEWSRLRWKRLMGPALWLCLRPLVDAYRGRPAAGSRTDSLIRGLGSRLASGPHPARRRREPT